MEYGKLSKPRLLFGDMKVEKFNDPDNPAANETIGYTVKGSRASYTLWRNKKDPHMLFAMGDPVCTPRKIRGFDWFYETPCGRLIPMR